jgi:hypothetical protein
MPEAERIYSADGRYMAELQGRGDGTYRVWLHRWAAKESAWVLVTTAASIVGDIDSARRLGRDLVEDHASRARK